VCLQSVYDMVTRFFKALEVSLLEAELGSVSMSILGCFLCLLFDLQLQAQLSYSVRWIVLTSL